MKKLVLAILRFAATKTHNVKAQLLLASFFGLISIYGFGPTFAILMKIRNQELQKERKQHATTGKKESPMP